MKAEAPACALTARRPAEMLIMNKVLGFHNNLQVGRTPLSEPELNRGVRTAENTPAQRVRDGQKERKQTDRRFLRGEPLCTSLFVMILMKLSFRGSEGTSEAVEGSAPLVGRRSQTDD